MSTEMLRAMAELAGTTVPTQAVEVKPLVLTDVLTLHALGFYTEKPSPDGNGIMPTCLYGILDGGGMVRLQGQDAILWYEGLKEALAEARFAVPVLEYEGKILEPKLKGATWAFEVEKAYVGKEVKHKTWSTGDAYEIHGGMLAGPTKITIREHKPPKRATYRVIELGYE